MIEEIIEKLNQYFGYNAISKISVVQDFDIKDAYKKNKKREKNKNTQSKIINKVKKGDVKMALKKLNKTLFEYYVYPPYWGVSDIYGIICWSLRWFFVVQFLSSTSVYGRHWKPIAWRNYCSGSNPYSERTFDTNFMWNFFD